MTRKRTPCKFCMQFALILTLVLSSLAQNENIVARFVGVQRAEEAARPLATSATPTPAVITFNPAPVGISKSSAQTLTAAFDVSGYSGSFTPTATLNYGHDYSAGPVGCIVSGATETCTVSITFQPTLPGARKDALFLLNGSTQLATVLIGGIGQSPLALIQPGVVTNPVLAASYYNYNSAVDENGTSYVLSNNNNVVYSVTKTGAVTNLTVTGLTSPQGIAIDGAGTLYIAQNTESKQIVTYNPATGVQGAITVDPPSPYVPCSSSNGGTLEYLTSVAVDEAGDLYALEIECGEVFELNADGSYKTTAINPAITQPGYIAVDSTGDIFVGGYEINEIQPSGTQSQINTTGATEGIAVDAAATVYATRNTTVSGVAVLPASDYATPLASLDPGTAPLGVGLASDGTLFVGNYTNLDKVDRTQGTIAFGEQFTGTASAPQDAAIYNGGNMPLSVSKFALTGSTSGFALQDAATENCTDGIVLAPGAFCQVAVTLTPPHAGIFSGTVTFTSNSLNTASTTQAVALSGFAYGVYVTPSPTSLTFPGQASGTTSAAQTVTLTNNGYLYSASFGTPSVPSGFNVSLGNCVSGIAVGQNCQINVTFEPTTAQPYGGTVTIPVSSSGGGSPPSVTFTVSGSLLLASQTITFPNPGPVSYGVAPITLSATATSGLPVQYSVSSGPATLSGNVLTITGAGMVTVMATQSGDGVNWAPAAPVSDIITVLPAPLTVTANNASKPFGTANPALNYSITGLVNGDPSTVVSGTAALATTATTASPVGTYPISFSTESLTAANYTFRYVSGSLVVYSSSQPLLFWLSSNSAPAGGAGFPLQVFGANFTANSLVLWNGLVRKTTYINSAQLTVAVLTSDIAQQGISLVAVDNPAPNAATSAPQPFAVESPVAAILAAALSHAADGSGNHSLSVTGIGFVSGSVVQWKGADLPTTYVSPWALSAVVSPSDYASRPATVTVANPTSGTSAGLELP